MQATVAELAAFIGGQVLGDDQATVRGFSGIREAGPEDLTFVGDSRYMRYLPETRAAAVVAGPGVTCPGKTLIHVAEPFRGFMTLVHQFTTIKPCPPTGIHPTAVVEAGAILGKGVALGAHCYIGARTRLGDRVVVYPGAYVGADCTVGDDTILHANTTLREGTVLGARCILHAGSALGTDGFGYYAAEGRQHKIPQLGTVELGDDVEVGSLSAIDRATFGTTRIGAGTKIDNLVQIGHNTQIGEHCIVCGAVGISGSASIGNHVTLAARAGVAGHLEIGDHVTVAGQSGVTKSVPPGKVVSGFPAVDHTEEKRMKVSLRRLPDALRAIRALEERIEQLETKLNAGKTENRST